MLQRGGKEHAPEARSALRSLGRPRNDRGRSKCGDGGPAATYRECGDATSDNVGAAMRRLDGAACGGGDPYICVYPRRSVDTYSDLRERAHLTLTARPTALSSVREPPSTPANNGASCEPPLWV